MSHRPIRTVPLATVLTVVLVGVGLAVGGVAAADLDTADRTIEETELLPGETTEVTVEITVDEESGPFLIEEFDPAFEDVSIVSADPFTEIGGSTDANDGLTAGWGDDGTEYTVTYEVTVPEDAEPGDEFQFNGSVSTTTDDGEPADETTVTGDATITVVEEDTEFGERSIRAQEMVAGGDTTVTVDIGLPETNGPFLTESFSAPFADASVSEADPMPETSGVNNATDELIAGWEATGRNYTLVYTVEIPDDAEPGDVFSIDGSVGIGDDGTDGVTGEVVGDENITVIEPPESAEDYADEESGQVDGDGVSNAFSDWQNGVADSSVLQDVFSAWQRGDIVL